MSSILYSYFLKKTKLDNYLKVGPDTDPYFEEIPKDELHFYQRTGSKRRRKLPQFIPKNDLVTLESVKRKAYRLDLQLSICGIRLGWAGVLGLIPWIGDIIALYFALKIVKKAGKIEGGLPLEIRSSMMSNVTFDFAIGLIPIVGDLINIAYKCNSRNFILLEQYLVGKYDVENHGKPPIPPRDHDATNPYTDQSPVSSNPVQNQTVVPPNKIYVPLQQESYQNSKPVRPPDQRLS